MSDIKFYEPSGHAAPSYAYGVAAESRSLEGRLKKVFEKTGEVPPSAFAQKAAARNAASARTSARKPA